jgi:RecB family endonuclease NucS
VTPDAGLRAEGDANDTVFTLAPDELRAQLAERPELIEPGLRVWRDPHGRAVGAGYETDVGPIDLLAQDAEGRLVVVQVAESGIDAVPELLSRVGWVAKHVAGKRGVRAIALLEPPVPELGYAARALTDTVSFRTYRVTLRFEEVEV